MREKKKMVEEIKKRELHSTQRQNERERKKMFHEVVHCPWTQRRSTAVNHAFKHKK